MSFQFVPNRTRWQDWFTFVWQFVTRDGRWTRRISAGVFVREHTGMLCLFFYLDRKAGPSILVPGGKSHHPNTGEIPHDN
jgi:hypothetical protein